MKIKKGTTRTVFVFDRLAVKFPVIGAKSILKLIKYEIKDGNYRFLLESFWKFNWRQYGSPQRFLFAGIITNWKEFIYFLKNSGDPFLTKTFISLFGLVNVQEAGKPFEVVDQLEFENTLIKLMGLDAWMDPHVFSDQSSFIVTADDKVKIVDYGDPKTHEVLAKYSSIIAEALPKLLK
ncbi:MAG: hypothetical protein WC310_01675 [Patescibacteria group bacterium]|jgi:hypothetical protein